MLECLLEQAQKACLGQTLQLITKIRNLRREKFYNIGPRAKCYKTLYVSNLIMILLYKPECLFWQALHVCGQDQEELTIEFST
jgi:hypothetical protein